MAKYIRMDDDRYMEMALPHIKKVVTRDCDYEKIAKMVKTRIEVFPDIEALVDFFQEVPEYDSDMYVHKKMKTTKESSLQLLNEVLQYLRRRKIFLMMHCLLLLVHLQRRRDTRLVL